MNEYVLCNTIKSYQISSSTFLIDNRSEETPWMFQCRSWEFDWK